MNQRKQWTALFAIEKNLPYETHMRDTKELAQVCLKSAARGRKPSLSFSALIRKQLKFLAWKIWFLQGMVLAALCAAFFCLYSGSIINWFAGTLPRFLCCSSGVVVMSAIPLMRRSSRYRMSELEQSTRFSVAGSLAAQLLFIGTGDLGMLAVLAFAVGRYGLTGTVIFISLVVPFLTTAATCLMLWARTTPSFFEKTAVLLCILTTLLMDHIIGLYRDSNAAGRIGGWLLYTLVCLGILCREYRRLRSMQGTENML